MWKLEAWKVKGSLRKEWAVFQVQFCSPKLYFEVLILLLENPMDRGAWWAAVHGVIKGWTWLSDSTFTFHFHALEKEMATHSSALAWRIPGMGEPRGLLCMGLHRVGHDWSDLAAAAATLLPVNVTLFESMVSQMQSSSHEVIRMGPNPIGSLSL